MPRRCSLAALVLTLAGVAAAQPLHPNVDPAESYLIAGRVLTEDGRPAVGVRVRGFRDDNPRFPYFDLTTDAEGRFRFEHFQLGFPSDEWHFTVNRPRCAEVQARGTLHEQGGVHTNVDVTIRLARCAKP